MITIAIDHIESKIPIELELDRMSLTTLTNA